jgi:hypothetical protein
MWRVKSNHDSRVSCHVMSCHTHSLLYVQVQQELVLKEHIRLMDSQQPQQPQQPPPQQQLQPQHSPRITEECPVNLEFLRNIVLGYIENTGDRTRLLPVLAELLQFSENDVHRVQQRSAGWAGSITSAVSLGWK